MHEDNMQGIQKKIQMPQFYQIVKFVVQVQTYVRGMLICI